MNEQPIHLYRPSNGTEGQIFFENWCYHCARDKAMREGQPFDECDDNELCEIIGKTFEFDIDEPGYPTEWRYGADGDPCCAAFIEAGSPVPVKDEHTIDMFADAESA